MTLPLCCDPSITPAPHPQTFHPVHPISCHPTHSLWPLAHQNSDTRDQPGWPGKGRGSRARENNLEDRIPLLLCSFTQQPHGAHPLCARSSGQALGTRSRPQPGERVVYCSLSVFLYREGLALVSLFFEEYPLMAA